jgi:hypothetical protein
MQWKSVENKYACNVGGAIHKIERRANPIGKQKGSVTPDKARKRQDKEGCGYRQGTHVRGLGCLDDASSAAHTVSGTIPII